MNNIKKIIEATNKGNKKDVYNILTFPTHERYETQLAKTGHNFFSFNIPNAKQWNDKQLKPPANYFILPQSNVCSYLNYDLILVQSRYWQFQVAQQINQLLHLPIVCLDHTLPPIDIAPQANIETMRNMVGDINVFISEYSRDMWNINGESMVIHHSIDSEIFKPLDIERKDYILTVANDFIKRDYCLNYSGFCRVTDGLEKRIIGETEGLSESAPSTEALVEEYNKCGVYFNSSTTPIPMSFLEAMSCGCAVVSVATSMIPSIIENGVNGFISNDEKELRSYITALQNDKELRLKIGTNARKTILDKFTENRFIAEWNTIFNRAYEVTIS
ncbi:MAG: glycosyltransferase family 1 protein [Proteobacteria bacterium]|nr:glycosyltransferase family 1 protein [Pseudomonadota bacterium]NBP13687.1 glycosyltransferase family 1 protein [bacterium]